jgi:hypothetical protein
VSSDDPRGALAAQPDEDVPALVRRKFDFALDLRPAEVMDAFRNHPDVAWTDGSPDPFPDLGGPTYQAWPRDETSFYIRVATGAAEQTLSPVVMVQMEETHFGTKLEGQFLRHPPRSRSYERLIKGTLWASAAFGAAWLVMVAAMLAWEPIIGITYLFNIMTIISPIAIALPFTVRNSPTKESMLRHGQSLWSLIGGVFVPHALGEGEAEDPFRERALGPGR